MQSYEYDESQLQYVKSIVYKPMKDVENNENLKPTFSIKPQAREFLIIATFQ